MNAVLKQSAKPVPKRKSPPPKSTLRVTKSIRNIRRKVTKAINMKTKRVTKSGKQHQVIGKSKSIKSKMVTTPQTLRRNGCLAVPRTG